MPDSFQKKLQHKNQQIDRLLDSFQPLLDVVKVRELDIIELSALATSFVTNGETWSELKKPLVQLLDMDKPARRLRAALCAVRRDGK